MKQKNTHEIRTLYEVDGGEESKNGWIKLVSYGEYPHRLGVQVVDRKSCGRMAEQFSSLYQRLARRFHGVPIYIGHPDDPAFRGQTGHGDTRAYGWVKHLTAKDDGLWVYAQWSDAGRELLKNAHFKFMSPRWEMNPMGENRFAPQQLISIGLTNYPNMDVEAIANQKIPGEAAACATLPNYPTSATAANGVTFGENILARESITSSLCRRMISMDHSEKARQQQLLAAVRRRMTAANETFSKAWYSVKQTSPILFENFSHLAGG
jgi:hypothetical protein